MPPAAAGRPLMMRVGFRSLSLSKSCSPPVGPNGPQLTVAASLAMSTCSRWQVPRSEPFVVFALRVKSSAGCLPPPAESVAVRGDVDAMGRTEGGGCKAQLYGYPHAVRHRAAILTRRRIGGGGCHGVTGSAGRSRSGLTHVHLAKPGLSGGQPRRGVQGPARAIT